MEANRSSAILFPGDGVGGVAARHLVRAFRPDLLDLAVGLVGEDPFDRIWQGAVYSHPAVYCASIASYERLGRPGAEYFAGHAFGELGALAAARALNDADGLRAVVARTRAMEEAVRIGGPGGMLAVSSDRVSADVLIADHRLTVAHENSPEEVVLAGPLQRVEEAFGSAKAMGIRAKRLSVSGAFHTDAMAPGVELFRAALEEIEIGEPDAPVVSSVSGELVTGDIREGLARSLVRPVRWTVVLDRLHDLGATQYVDVGPGNVLAGFVTKTLAYPHVETVAACEAKGI
jgi:[acyl-carrier-protein] S-malonyltransferase